MKILITGGAGFIGSHLSELLLQDEETHVTVVDSLSTGTYRNIEHCCAPTLPLDRGAR
jgi:nucleoside-diphosphate-sugar epimerase